MQVFRQVTQSSVISHKLVRYTYMLTTRDIACYFASHPGTPLSANSPRVKSCTAQVWVSPELAFASRGYVNPPKLTRRTNLKSDGSSRKQSRCRFICYFYYLISSYFSSQIAYSTGKVGVPFILPFHSHAASLPGVYNHMFFMWFLGPVA